MLQSSLSQQICDTHKNKCTWKWVLWRDYPSTFQKYTPCTVWDLGLKWRGGKWLRFFHVLSNVSRLWSRNGIDIFGKKTGALWILRIEILEFFPFYKNEKFLLTLHKVVLIMFTIILSWTISRFAWCLRTTLAIAASHTSHHGRAIITFCPWRRERFVEKVWKSCSDMSLWKKFIISLPGGLSLSAQVAGPAVLGQ